MQRGGCSIQPSRCFFKALLRNKQQLSIAFATLQPIQSHMNIDQIRADTPGCQQLIHLNNAGASLMPASVANTIRHYLTEEEKGGGYETADRYQESLNQFYDCAAQLLNAGSRNIAFTSSATDSYNKALSSIPFRQGDVVLLSGNDYPSHFIALMSLQKRTGIRLERVRNNDSGEIDLEDLEQKIKQLSPRLVSVTHVPTSSGLVQPVTAIGNIIRRYDTLFLLDACQSLGQMPVDAAATGADFISGTFRKFLRGPRGTGLLYVSDKVLDAGLELLFPDLRGGEWQSEHRYAPRQDARRFEDWETAYALQAGSTAALTYALSLGLQHIENRNRQLSDYVRKALANTKGTRLQDRGEHLCSIITFSLACREETATKQYFRENGINISTTNKSSAMIDFKEKGVDWVVRVSPHYYNTEAELDRFVDVLQAM